MEDARQYFGGRDDAAEQMAFWMQLAMVGEALCCDGEVYWVDWGIHLPVYLSPEEGDQAFRPTHALTVGCRGPPCQTLVAAFFMDNIGYFLRISPRALARR